VEGKVKMFELLFIRHGQTDWNLQSRVMGRQPIPLNEKGKWQAKRLAAYLKGIKIDAMATSPVKRAMETAEILLRGRQELQLIVDERLSEIEYGDWLNLTFTDLATQYADIWKDYHQNPETVNIPGGEKLPHVCERTVQAITEIRNRHPKGRLAIISHADVIKLAIIRLLKWPMNLFKCFSMDNGAMLLLRDHPTLGMRVIWYNPMNGFGRDL